MAARAARGHARDPAASPGKQVKQLDRREALVDFEALPKTIHQNSSPPEANISEMIAMPAAAHRFQDHVHRRQVAVGGAQQAVEGDRVRSQPPQPTGTTRNEDRR